MLAASNRPGGCEFSLRLDVDKPMSTEPEPTTEAPAAAAEAAPASAPAAAPAAAAPAAAISFVPGEAGKSDAPAAVDDDEKRAAAIKKQVEYYFSEANLTNDKFMRTEMAKTSEKWVPISVIMTFNRMKALLPGAEHAPVAAAMAGSEVVEVSEDGEKLRRLPALMKKTVTLGGKEFVGRAAVVAHARPLLQKEGELAEEECSFIKDLLSHHAKAAEKIGAGIASIKAGCNPKFPDTRCFVLVRADGSEATACAGRGQPPDLGEGRDSCVPHGVTTGGLFVPQVRRRPLPPRGSAGQGRQGQGQGQGRRREGVKARARRGRRGRAVAEEGSRRRGGGRAEGVRDDRGAPRLEGS